MLPVSSLRWRNFRGTRVEQAGSRLAPARGLYVLGDTFQLGRLQDHYTLSSALDDPLLLPRAERPARRKPRPTCKLGQVLSGQHQINEQPLVRSPARLPGET